LYQLYTTNSNIPSADNTKEHILKNYPESKFAAIIKSPNKKLNADENKEDLIYKQYRRLYYLYKEEKCEEVLQGIKSFEQIVNNSELIPKLALLKALTIGKHQSIEAYKKELEYVAFSYANTEEGQKAQEILSLLITL